MNKIVYVKDWEISLRYMIEKLNDDGWKVIQILQPDSERLRQYILLCEKTEIK